MTGDVHREGWDRRRDATIQQQLVDLSREVHATHLEVQAAHEQARGAHAQALRTNGRVTDLERREEAHLAESRRLSKAVFGQDTGSLEDDGGMFGYIRAQRRDTRLLAAWAVVGLPMVMTALLAFFAA